MRTLLLFPPASDPAHPPLGIASLAGYLRERDERVELADLNLGSYELLLSADYLEHCTGRLEHRIGELEAMPQLAAEQAREYELVVRNLSAAAYLKATVPAALDQLRDPAVYQDLQRYDRAVRCVRRGMELVSAACYPVRWYPRGFSMGYRPTVSAEVLAATADQAQNPFLWCFERMLPALLAEPPELVGISINYYCQLIPALTLAACVRRLLPDTLLVAGGGLLCFYEGAWQSLAAFQHMVDAWVPYEGEVPLVEILRAHRLGKPLSSIPGVLAFEQGRARFRQAPESPHPASLPVPSFDGLPLDRYLAPQLTLPLLTARGCYWGRCAFCSHDQLYGHYRRRPPAAVVNDMALLSQRYGCRHFYLVDEAIPPATAEQIAGAVRSGELAASWFGEVRFERVLDEPTLQRWAAGGCLMLMFGLESAVPRVLDQMHKGTRPAQAAAILRWCRRLGIRTFVMFFSGFPTETRQEAEATVRFVESLQDEITRVAFTNFVLEHSSPVYKSPGSYGVCRVIPAAEEDLKIFSTYEVISGMSDQEASAFAREIRDREGIKTLIEQLLLSRSHLVFLPVAAETPVADDLVPAPDLGDPDRIYPCRAPELVPLTLSFNLEDVGQLRKGLEERGRRSQQERQAAATRAGAVPRPTNYLFDAAQDQMHEVGEHGLALLGPCDGVHSLGQILRQLGHHNHEATVAYYRALSRKGLLTWERRV